MELNFLDFLKIKEKRIRVIEPATVVEVVMPSTAEEEELQESSRAYFSNDIVQQCEIDMLQREIKSLEDELINSKEALRVEQLLKNSKYAAILYIIDSANV